MVGLLWKCAYIRAVYTRTNFDRPMAQTPFIFLCALTLKTSDMSLLLLLSLYIIYGHCSYITKYIFVVDITLIIIIINTM